MTFDPIILARNASRFFRQRAHPGGQNLDGSAARRPYRDEGRHATEAPGTQSAQALAIIAQNIDQAADCEGAICQDTGMPTFEVKTPIGANQIEMKGSNS